MRAFRKFGSDLLPLALIFFAGCATRTETDTADVTLLAPVAEADPEAADIREAVYRHQFEHNASGQQKSALAKENANRCLAYIPIVTSESIQTRL